MSPSQLDFQLREKSSGGNSSSLILLSSETETGLRSFPLTLESSCSSVDFSLGLNSLETGPENLSWLEKLSVDLVVVKRSIGDPVDD